MELNTDADKIQGPKPPQVHLDPDDSPDSSDLQLNQKKVTIQKDLRSTKNMIQFSKMSLEYSTQN